MQSAKYGHRSPLFNVYDQQSQKVATGDNTQHMRVDDSAVGTLDGLAVGSAVGALDGLAVGSAVGALVGSAEGSAVGTVVGSCSDSAVSTKSYWHQRE